MSFSSYRPKIFMKRAWLTLAIISMTQVYTLTWMFGVEPHPVFGGYGNLLVLYGGVLGILVMAIDVSRTFWNAYKGKTVKPS